MPRISTQSAREKASVPRARRRAATATQAEKAEPAADRKRRTPEEAKRLILAAAQTLIAARGPDAVGLKDVARAAGVSHGLVTHYFGTYENLVEEALVEHLQSQRLEGLQLIQAAGTEPEAWLAIAFEQFAHPLTVRLLVWALLTGRLEQEDFVVFRTRGLAATVDVLESYVNASGATIDRDTLERAVMIGICAAIGYTLGRKPLWGSLGRRASAQRDDEFQKQLAAMLLSALRRTP
ncbi:MAG: TetR/AcrR family transcriptional regulator [Deltaproteobacteria bacterium]|nr:TetR/AcrR family transcriptional regulator [Deltaproteobacteria bacterium]